MALSAIAVAETAGDVKRDLSDDEVIAVVAAEARKRTEMIDVYANAGRDDRAEIERGELEVFSRYLPAAVSEDELAAIVAEEVANAAAAGTTGPKATGAVIGAVRNRVGTRADGATIARLVKAAL